MYFDKSDGGQFRGAMVDGQDWDERDYSSKLIGGQYFFAGAQAAGFDFQYDYLSPRDGDGHGSHTASTAAGNFGVDAEIEGKKLKQQKKQKNRHKGTEPYTDGTYVYFDKSDGGQFRGAMVDGQDWDERDYSSKLIGG
ncbi:hypothetical protein CTI14_42130, partial [Methylobacterium radiotolerans]